jgi:hypothetical protein
MLRVLCGLAALLFIIRVPAQNRPSSQTPVAALTVPRGWRTYTDRRHGFRISYPPTYKRIRKRSDAVGMIRLQHRSLDASIFIYASNMAFDLQKLIEQAPTGVEDTPQPQQVGGRTFYYYGPGGGGVCYPDSYFFNLRGKTLSVDFAGPCVDDKTPTAETKALEPLVLASVQVLKLD